MRVSEPLGHDFPSGQVENFSKVLSSHKSGLRDKPPCFPLQR